MNCSTSGLLRWNCKVITIINPENNYWPFHFYSHFCDKSDHLMQPNHASVVFIKYSKLARIIWKKKKTQKNRKLLPECFDKIFGCELLVHLLAHHLEKFIKFNGVIGVVLTHFPNKVVQFNQKILSETILEIYLNTSYLTICRRSSVSILWPRACITWKSKSYVVT